MDRAKEHINWLKVNFKNVSSLSKELSETTTALKMLFVKVSKDKYQIALVNSKQARMTTFSLLNQ